MAFPQVFRAALLLPDIVLGVQFSPDGTRLATAGGSTVRLWDTLSWTVRVPFPGCRCFCPHPRGCFSQPLRGIVR
jgi:WD40 repeat protein